MSPTPPKAISDWIYIETGAEDAQPPSKKFCRLTIDVDEHHPLYDDDDEGN
uniref:Uncharacterized protein n=1 Tax=Plectus sambesii TaxID=2011161 RepID=A0A914WAI1_9BILA